tara:strand:+ start:92 stop:304 length:213 start_codon:yes stop_codon:yes gene_type:complete
MNAKLEVSPTFKAVKSGNWIAVREHIPCGLGGERASWVTVELCHSASEAAERVKFWTAKELRDSKMLQMA